MLLTDIDLIVFDMDGTLYQLDGENNSIKDSSLYKRIINNSVDFVRNREKVSKEKAEDIINEAMKDDVGISMFLSKRYNITRKDYFDEAWNVNPEGIIREYEIPAMVVNNVNAGKVLLTSAPEVWQKRVFNYIGIRDSSFVSIYTGEMYHGKEDIFIKLAQSNSPERILSVGDQMHTDIEPAKKLGMKTMHVKHPKDLSKLLS